MKGFVAYIDDIAAMKDMSDEQIGKVFRALAEYTATGRMPQTEDITSQVVAGILSAKIDRDRQTYETRVQNGRLGGRPKKNPMVSDENRNNPMVSDENRNNQNENEKENVNVKVNEKERENRKRFTPPTLDEVRVYCSERNNSVDAQMFIDFYASKGWRVGNQSMKDWKAAIRTWEKRDNRPPQKKVSAQDYEQRDYSQKAHQEEMPDWLREGLEKMNIVEMKAKAE